MIVTDIEISHYHYDSNSARHCANVAVLADGNVVNLYCQINLPQDGDAESRNRGFADEATRQLRRMPEFRSGQRELQFAGHLGALS